ncbi:MULTISPECIES: TIGR03885 family FMN-dependent LLM class oxidoreductase [unclassified Microbacterium]|uniref:TIGR03885 family FMN-dependent LLM class oxidoreductase n=1 Tax=unclassified Microbacterium TaxID=2609290 RepID=UPI000EA9933D|nr:MULTISPECIES: TIGR03885 family FMN-dependent LLM class oxidoreductase [unclassified Microbacterium]MBT2486023.1 TIGR03885 family FMN-dependent LLM class oxidoreductase [Microbacterium sp. ISL-108]RKN68765.1 TIGR03557 family F420-dependent LLM class oxidoreductase [Microbacterium sp. CGR2]
MAFIGFHASHEQIPPSALLKAVIGAERAGFDGAMSSDHLAPWTPSQGESGFALSWIAAALARTEFPIGMVNAPGQRYHPVLIAQAFATLEEMFPGRFWAAMGSGEAVNEHITGDPWPPKAQRNERLRESVDVIRRLMAGEEVDHDGLVRVHRARVWSRPAQPPPLFATAVSAETAGWAASWADGLATVAQEPKALRSVVDAYRSAGGDGPCILQVHLSWADTDAAAFAIARDQWRNGLLAPPVTWDLEQPEDFENAVKGKDESELRSAVLIDHDASSLAERIAELVQIGFDRVYLHHVGTEQSEFLDVAASDLIPALKEKL